MISCHFICLLKGEKQLRYKHIFFISPPFYSHFTPLLTLAKSFYRLGAKVTFGCSSEFKEKVLQANLDFYEIDISSNKNVGQAEETDQPTKDRERLEEFFESTRVGAAETLMTQSRHRKADMLHSPDKIMSEIKAIDDMLDIDLFIVDILSYSLTLSLYALDLPFVTFCPPHPRTIPEGDEQYSVPVNWPSAIKVEDHKVDQLRHVSKTTQKEFTKIFNQIIKESDAKKEEIENAFSLVSPHATIYNYFDFDDKEFGSNPKKIFIGNCFDEAILSEDWREKVEGDNRKILITLGTFLSNRLDVLEQLIEACIKFDSDATLIVSAGSNAVNLKEFQSERVIISDFIPQCALMPYMDLVIFHGGCNTFTESMYYGNPMVIIPFSSDQFNIAHDAEQNNLAEILDPNNLIEEDIIVAIASSLDRPREELIKWSNISKNRGAEYAAHVLLEV